MSKSNRAYLLEFEEKYGSLEEINADWYKRELGVEAYCKVAKCSDKNGDYQEEWYRARFVYMLIKSGLYPKENICVELSLPKGNGGKAIKPDLVVFRSKDWVQWLKEHDFEKIRKNIIVVMEAKDNPDEVEKAIEKQLEVALERRLASPDFEDWAYGVYFDNNLDGIVILKKEGLEPLQRLDVSKMINGTKNIVRLNVAKRDDIEELPSFAELDKNVAKAEKKYEFTYDDLSPIGEDSFQSILDFIQREKDKLQVPNTKDLLVEILTLKVHDEMCIKETGEFSRFYIADNEIRPSGFATQSFRKRLIDLYEAAKQVYQSIRERQHFSYRQTPNEGLVPYTAADEKMVISMFKAFQGKSILKGCADNFNQTIFNNFGDEVEKTVAGQFFTPVHIIKGIMPILNPRPLETVSDPCAGIFDFLAMSWRLSGSRGDALNYYGFDISPVVLKLAELNLVLNGVGTANIHQKNSIYEKMMVNNSFTTISSFTVENYIIDKWTHVDDRVLNIKLYDLIITNPPFGKGRDLKTGKDGVWDFGLTEDNLKLYETWVLSGCPKSIDMGVIFLENAYKLTRPGGRFGIVLSNSIASIASWAEVRMWLMERVRLVAVIDLPQNSFGETGVATTILIAYKPKEDEQYLLENDYEVFIKEIKYTGYEVKTVQRNVIFEPLKKYDEVTFRDTGELKEDFTDMNREFEEFIQSQEIEVKKAFGRA